MGLALIAMASPACHSARAIPGDSSRVAYRPVQTSLKGRPFYVSGYGGADYTPARPRRGMPVDAAPAYVTPAPASVTPAPEANAPQVTIRQGTWDEP
jgi:hypothetical protein